MVPPGSMTRYTIALPQLVDEAVADTTHLRHFVAEAERLGYAGVWANELLSAPILDPLALLAYVAAATERVRLGVGVLLLPLRSPLQLARELAAIDQLSGGRLTVGVGLGSSKALYGPLGVPERGRVRRFEAGIQLLTQLWSDDEVTFDSEWWQLDQLTLEPKPRQRPRPPLWFGARSEPALDRAVRLGDGWIGSGAAPLDEFRKSLDHVRQQLASTGRDASSFSTGKRVYVHVDSDVRRGTEHVRAWFAAYYGNAELGERVTIVGDADDCVERVAEIAVVGVDEILLNPVDASLEQMEALAALVDRPGP